MSFPEDGVDLRTRPIARGRPAASRGPHCAQVETPKEASPSIALLSEEQRHILDVVLTEGASLFFTGNAGTGKSFLLRIMIHELRRLYGCKKVFVTASTGIAAAAIGGTTLHSFAGIKLGLGTPEQLCRDMKASYRNRWKRAEVLVIDEVSMLDGQYLDVLNAVAQQIRGNDEPMGGIQVCRARLPVIHAICREACPAARARGIPFPSAAKRGFWTGRGWNAGVEVQGCCWPVPRTGRPRGAGVVLPPPPPAVVEGCGMMVAAQPPLPHAVPPACGRPGAFTFAAVLMRQADRGPHSPPPPLGSMSRLGWAGRGNIIPWPRGLNRVPPVAFAFWPVGGFMRVLGWWVPYPKCCGGFRRVVVWWWVPYSV